VLGVAFGGGGVRCFAHLGVLKVLQQERVSFDVVAGSSAGALMAVLYGLGMEPAEIERLVCGLRWRQIIGWRPSRHGLGDPERFLRFLRALTREARLEALPRRVLVTATDITEGRVQVFDEGPAAEAVYASCALPGLFPPHRHEGRSLVDGAFLAPLPVDLLRRHGAQRCVGVYCPDRRSGPPRHVLGTTKRCLDVMMHHLAAQALAQADLLITPQVGECGTLDFKQMRRCIGAGEWAATAALPALRQLLSAPRPAVATTP